MPTKSVDVDIELDEFGTDELLTELSYRISNRFRKQVSAYEKEQIKNTCKAILKELFEPDGLAIKTLNDKMKYEHLIKVFEKYNLSDFENKLPE